MERRNTVLGSLRNKFSRKDSAKAAEASSASRSGTNRMSTASGNMPALTPATRRPDRPGMNAFTTPSTEPPPAYTPTSSNSVQVAPAELPASTIPAPSATTAPAADDRYAFLSSFDTIFLIDDSGSMAGRSWRETRKALETITPICTAHDADGIDIFFLNHPDSPFHHNVTLSSTVGEIFSTVRPRGGTPTGQRLNQILKPYLQKYEREGDATKPLNVIVITDGEPSDDVESVIISAAKKLDRFDAPAWQVGIQFFQVGSEPSAKEHLRQLDDDLAELAGESELRDIVDTVPFTGKDGEELTGDGILKVCLGAVNRRLDRKRSKDLHR
ncbi:hypothetical protein K490DRAFT_67603 [Saccharata proteae CBS 121410]|uniref:VWFA domain-containing protein n=1 Tax=Saccharata proteae CBS 121410 TaxID=1314787 RepID=A0A9P4HUD1_9PEZI|nr:hypothetical protein K490DRAFT_67603 [Saccharata proteae CBS 121410]